MDNIHTLRLILGDQLNASHSWYRQRDAGVLYVIAELRQETDYVKHHVQKLCAFFAAMEAFATALTTAGHQVLYLTLDDSSEYADLPALLTSLCDRHKVSQFDYQRPDEYRLLQQLEQLAAQLSSQPSPQPSSRSDITVTQYDSEHFLLPFSEISDYFEPGRHSRMETFYRSMRKRFAILMEEDKPAGGRWNYDADNRNKLKPADLSLVPEPLLFANPVKHILARLERHAISHFGDCDEHLLWPITRTQAQALLEYFCHHCLPLFGRFQDAMTANSDHSWSLFHSRLSFALNAKLLHPMQVINAALDSFNGQDSPVDIAQVEGFIRQILGWREHIRGVYWANMPAYAERNSLAASRDLPAFFWSGATKMSCMRQAISQSLHYAYAHHIQRLMITGNFCLLTGIDPAQVDAWYLGIYVDAIEWVEMPNTRGMSQFADGGIIATKPYAASGNYINKMSDYCKDCHYDVKQKDGEQACPFNSLYWRFMQQHRERLAVNPRIGMIYRNWDKQDSAKRQATLDRAERYLADINAL